MLKNLLIVQVIRVQKIIKMQTNKANDAKSSQYRKTSAEIISEAKSLLAGGHI